MKIAILIFGLFFWASSVMAKLSSIEGAAFPPNPNQSEPISLVVNLIHDSSCENCTVVFYLFSGSGVRKHQQIFTNAEFSQGALRAFGYNLLLDEKFPPGNYSLSMVVRDARGILIDKKNSFMQFRVEAPSVKNNPSIMRTAGNEN